MASFNWEHQAKKIKYKPGGTFKTLVQLLKHFTLTRITSYLEIWLCKKLIPLGCLDASMFSPRSVGRDSKCYPVMAEAFKSILHFKRTCLAAELKGLCQLQVSQQLLFARDADEECPCSLRRGWLRGSPCVMTVPGSDGRPGSYSSTCAPPNASCAVQEGGGQ